jgi:hypothetical protein
MAKGDTDPDSLTDEEFATAERAAELHREAGEAMEQAGRLMQMVVAVLPQKAPPKGVSFATALRRHWPSGRR